MIRFSPWPGRHLLACQPPDTDLLTLECRSAFSTESVRALAAGWVELEIPGSNDREASASVQPSDSSDIEDPLPRSRSISDVEHRPLLALARQIAPNVVPLEEKTSLSLARGAVSALASALAQHPAPWRLHVFHVQAPGGSVGPKRCQAVRDLVMRSLDRCPELLDRLDAREGGPWRADETLAQIALVDLSRAFLSITSASARPRFEPVLSPWMGGIARVSSDRDAPSSAADKLLEAQAHMNRFVRQGERCVDLGASPGGWSHVAIKQGGEVLAVDRSPLRSDLMKQRRLRFHHADAFGYAPDRPVDWLFCDVVAAPERSMTLLERWLSARHCQHFVVTLKFRGPIDLAIVERAKALLVTRATAAQIRRLESNKNELTMFGSLG